MQLARLQTSHILVHWHMYTHEHEFVVCNTLDAPAAAKLLPAVQEAHVVAPVALEYLPATHRVHVAADDEDDPGVPYLPAAHAEPEHVADELAPVALEYFPATQKVHAAPDSADTGRVL